jgi:F0F1-type ATP synthase assembly protein I
MSPLVKYLRFSHVGLEFLAAVAIPTAIGIWADRKLGTGALLAILGLALGFGAGVVSLCRQVFPSTKGSSGGAGRRDDVSK